MIYQQMFDRVREPEVVRAALIGSGNFGTPIVTQASLIPRLELRVVADKNVEAARSAFLYIGVEDDDIAVCDSSRAALRAVETGKWLVAEDAMILMDLPLHVIVTATGVPEAGARYAYEAIRHGKHVVFVDKEADSVVGPMLKHLADRAGVVFTTDDGDQPGLVMGWFPGRESSGSRCSVAATCTISGTPRRRAHSPFLGVGAPWQCPPSCDGLWTASRRVRYGATRRRAGA